MRTPVHPALLSDSRWQAVGQQRVCHFDEVCKLSFTRLDHWHLLGSLLQQDLILLHNLGEPLQQQLHALGDLLSHKLGEPIEVVILLRPLSLVKVFVFIVRVFVVLVVGEGVHRLVGQVVVQVASDQVEDDLLNAALARHVEGHAFEEDALPQVV